MTMDFEKIERYVSDLMTVSGVEKEGKEQNVGLALYHLLMSAALHDLMSDDEKDLFKALTKKLQYFFCTRLNLKERRGKQKKENFPPNPLLKEKQTKGEEEKTLSLEIGAKEAFHRECMKRIGQYDEQQLADFYNWWSEEDAKGRMRFQTERYWNIDNRLKRWVKNRYSAENTAAAMRLQKQRQATETDTQVKQQQQARQREEADAQREAELEKSRENQMTTAEYINANPDGILAKIYREKHKNS